MKRFYSFLFLSVFTVYLVAESASYHYHSHHGNTDKVKTRRTGNHSHNHTDSLSHQPTFFLPTRVGGDGSANRTRHSPDQLEETSWPLLLAPSISSTSSARPSVISTQRSSSSLKSTAGPAVAFRHLAKIRAMVVLPVPRGPLKRYACAMRPEAMALLRVWVTCSCPTTSAKRCGRYLRAIT